MVDVWTLALTSLGPMTAYVADVLGHEVLYNLTDCLLGLNSAVAVIPE